MLNSQLLVPNCSNELVLSFKHVHSLDDHWINGLAVIQVLQLVHHHRVFFQTSHPRLFDDCNPNPKEGDQRVMLLVFHPISIPEFIQRVAFRTIQQVAQLFTQPFIRLSLLSIFHLIIFKIMHHRVNCLS